jgi:hypothetical protein
MFGFPRKSRNKAAIHLLKFVATPRGKRADEPC